LTRPPGRTAGAAAACLLLLASCAPSQDTSPHITIGWTPMPTVGRESVAEIQLNEAMARPVTGRICASRRS
jgi:hypothetical protein